MKIEKQNHGVFFWKNENCDFNWEKMKFYKGWLEDTLIFIEFE